MSVLEGEADLCEKLEALSDGEIIFVAVKVDGNTLDEFHDEIGATGVGGAGVKDFGDVGMVHEGEGLTFGFEARDDLFGVHSELDDFESDFSEDG